MEPDRIDTSHLGLRDFVTITLLDVHRLIAPGEHAMPSGDLPLNRETLPALMDYSRSLPTGQRPGKVWRRHLPAVDEWWLGRYGDPYPEGHEFHGSVPIDWWRIYVIGSPARWPRDVRVPSIPRPGPINAPLGGADGEEGEHCLRDNGRGGFCLSRIEYLPDARMGGCACPTTHPPCGYCVSSLPECPGCGWRAESC